MYDVIVTFCTEVVKQKQLTVEVSYDDFFKMVEEKQSEENPDNFSNCANINGYRFSYRDFG